MKKAIGIAMIVSFFMGLLMLVASEIGLLKTMVAAMASIAATAWFAIGVALASK